MRSDPTIVTNAVIPITYCYARVSKADDEAKNLETQLRELDPHGIRRDLVFTDEASDRTMDRPGWRDLMSRVQPGDTVVFTGATPQRSSPAKETAGAYCGDMTTWSVAGGTSPRASLSM